MHIASWRALPAVTILAVAAVMFWGLVTVFGSESTTLEEAPIVAAADTPALQRIPLSFPEVPKPLAETLPALEPSPEPLSGSVASTPAKSSSKTAKTVKIPTDGAAGDATVGADGDPTIGPNARSGPVDAGSDPVGNLNDDFENPKEFGPDEPKNSPDPEPEEPEEPEEPDVDEPSGNNGTHSGNSGNNGANGSSASETDDGDSEEGEED